MNIKTMVYNREFRRVILGLATFIIFFYLISIYRLIDSPISFPTSYFSYKVSPKEEFLTELENNPDYKQTGLNFQPTNPGIIPYNTTVLKKLRKLFPYDRSEPIPKQVWQMWKVGVDHPDFPESFTTLRQTWLDKSPDYDYIVKTNAECDAMIAELYADVPEIIHAYNIMPEVILQCDLGRYLILYAYGGIYTDLDTKLLKPIEDWFSSQESYLNKTLNLGLVVGIESDRPDWKTCCARRLQIQTWTIMARKGHPFLAELINSIVEHTLWREETGQLGVRMGRDASDNVINWTGPGRFTDFTFKYINNVFQTDFDNYETVINESFLTQTKLPIIIGDAMILPEECMHPTKKSKNGEFIDPRAHVRHVGSNVWKTDQKNKNKNESKEADKKKDDKKVDDKKKADKKVDDKKVDNKVDKQEKSST